MQAVRYDGFGGTEVLDIRTVDVPAVTPGHVLVRVVAAGINPGESNIRTGSLAELYPSTFPSGQGSDFAGTLANGDPVVGWVDTRSSHAEYVLAPVENLVAKPAEVPFEVAGALFVAGTTAWAAVQAVALKPGTVVAISGAAGGVGGIAAQLAVEQGARVLGIAGPHNHDWLRDHGVEPVSHEGGLPAVAQRLRELAPEAFIDTYGGGYVDLALDLGIPADRIDTVTDFAAAARHGVLTAGNAEGARQDVLAALVERLADGRLTVPIARTYPLAQVREAYDDLDRRRTRGKIVLLP